MAGRQSDLKMSNIETKRIEGLRPSLGTRSYGVDFRGYASGIAKIATIITRALGDCLIPEKR
jgi:hypothetical protein